ncbi:hypothetical protein Ahia01_000544800 [Argonauta hians]
MESVLKGDSPISQCQSEEIVVVHDDVSIEDDKTKNCRACQRSFLIHEFNSHQCHLKKQVSSVFSLWCDVCPVGDFKKAHDYTYWREATPL